MKEVHNFQKAHLSATHQRDGWMMLVIALLLMATVLFGCVLLVVDFEGWNLHIERPFLIPWVMATGLVIAAPSAYLFYRKNFSLAHPLVFATFTYFFPIFFLGGWSLTLGFSNYHYLNYVGEPEFNFPLTFIYIMVGFACLWIGFIIPWGRRLGNYFSNFLPKWEFNPTEVVMPSIFFLLTGILVSYVAFEFGQIGYQSSGYVVGDVGSLTYYLTLIIPASIFILWLAFFKMKNWNLFHFFIFIAQIFMAVFLTALQGGRSGPLNSLILMIVAFVMAGGKFLLKHWIRVGIVLPIVLIFGMTYGTTFRVLKANTDRVSIEQYGAVVLETLETINEKDWFSQTEESLRVLAERLEIVSSLGVVVANYEDLQSYEASYGLENNIWTYTWTAFIPRYIWKDKPMIADNYSYNELYFDAGGSGLAITVMGDLLRNFGPIGVPLGMIFLGFWVRVFYSLLIENLPFSMWRSTIYFTILIKISYDSFYGEILPTVIRVAVVVFIQLFILKIVIYALRRNATN